MKRLFLILVLMLQLVPIFSQCPMCRIAAESNLENGGTAGTGLNSGILYMLAMPYLIVAFLAYIWYKNRKKDQVELREV